MKNKNGPLDSMLIVRGRGQSFDIITDQRIKIFVVVLWILKSPFTNDYGKKLKSLRHPKGQAFLKFFLDYRPKENIQRSCCADQYIFCSTLSVRNLLALSIKELAG
jgi:hypothetical protein